MSLAQGVVEGQAEACVVAKTRRQDQSMRKQQSLAAPCLWTPGCNGGAAHGAMSPWQTDRVGWMEVVDVVDSDFIRLDATTTVQLQ